MMSPDDQNALQSLLATMRAAHSELSARRAGVCVLHMEAAVAALESRLLRAAASMADTSSSGLAVLRVLH